MSSHSYENRVQDIEAKWQEYWQRAQIFRSPNPGEPGGDKPKFYALVMFPYPSGDGLHVGHPLSYTAVDIVSRKRRMLGFNVLHPMGWDAFGLPAEQYAIQKKIHPAVSTQKNIATFKRQLQRLGNSYDWSREIDTTDPSYVKWTQWLFKKLYEKGLAYEKEGLVNWCPALGTVLANDEVIDGKSERGGHPVERRPMRQWYLKITEYAERLLQDLDHVDWPEATKEMQRNWIGKSEGAKIRFPLAGPAKAPAAAQSLEVFTTRPDTLMGVTFMVIAPEHPLLWELTSPEQRPAVEQYLKEAAVKSDIQRTDLAKQKTGVALGGHVLHPVSGKKIPVWTADYVLMNYGTGAIMAVPAHDERDLEFAETFGLEIIEVIREDNTLINSDSAALAVNGLGAKEGAKRMVEFLQAKNQAEFTITYRLRDWAFSRQRYWGEPFPLIHCEDGSIELVPDSALPLELPNVENYAPSGTGESPLAAIPQWLNTVDPKTGKPARRETNTMPGSAGSSWYFLRFADALNSTAPWSAEAEKYWLPVDLYVGGSEHTVGHLLYSRFWMKVFFDLGLVSHSEPFQKLVHQGMILGEDGEKMSKSRGNVVNPDDVIRAHGADAMRLFVMFLGPLEKEKPWQTKGIDGVVRFLNRVWNLVINTESALLHPQVREVSEAEWAPSLRKAYHHAIKKVGDDIDHLRMNTAISEMMILVNECYQSRERGEPLPKKIAEGLALILSPFAPHLAEELWSVLGHHESLAYHPWPEFDPSALVQNEIELPVQINGKLRDRVTVSRDVNEDTLKALVLERPQVVRWLEGKPVKKFIYVKSKLVSIVV